MLSTTQAVLWFCDLLYLHHLLPPSPFRGEIWPWRVINPILKPRLWFRTKLLGLWQSRAVPIYIAPQYRWMAKQPKLQNRLENADFSLSDLFGDILGGNKKDIAGSHQLPRLHDDVDWKRYFIFVVCTPESWGMKERKPTWEKRKISSSKRIMSKYKLYSWKETATPNQ